jgi:hypothetical protein
MSKTHSQTNFPSSTTINYSNFTNWETEEVCNWLQNNNLQEFSDIFKKNSLTGYDLYHLNDEILKNELKLNNFHDRNTITKNVYLALLDLCNIYLKLIK